MWFAPSHVDAGSSDPPSRLSATTCDATPPPKQLRYSPMHSYRSPLAPYATRGPSTVLEVDRLASSDPQSSKVGYEIEWSCVSTPHARHASEPIYPPVDRFRSLSARYRHRALYLGADWHPNRSSSWPSQHWTWFASPQYSSTSSGRLPPPLAVPRSRHLGWSRDRCTFDWVLWSLLPT